MQPFAEKIKAALQGDAVELVEDIDDCSGNFLVILAGIFRIALDNGQPERRVISIDRIDLAAGADIGRALLFVGFGVFCPVALVICADSRAELFAEQMVFLRLRKIDGSEM